MRLAAASLRAPALRVVSACCLKCYPSSLHTQYRQTVGSVVAAAVCLYLGFNLLGIKGLLILWVIAETLFVLVNADRCWYFNQLQTPPEEDLSQIRLCFERFLKSLKHLDPKSHLNHWFMDDEFASLPEENILELIAYAFAFKKWKRGDRDSDFAKLLRDLLRDFQSQTGIQFKEGFKPNIRFRSHLWNNIRFCHYLLIFYCILEALGVLFTLMMGMFGFLSGVYRGRRYFVRGGSDSRQRPILFLHGLGVGPISYLSFIWFLRWIGHPIFVIELRQISMRFCLQTPTIDDIVNDIVGILELHRVDPCIVVGHSYGTFIASRLNARYPDKVAGLCLMDPVCCVMHNPKLLSTFVYRTLDWSRLTDYITSLLVVMLSHDPSIATSVCRQFNWTQLNLWPEDIAKKKTILVLSEADMLVPVKDVRKMFGHSDAKLLVHATHSHGSFVIDLEWQQEIVQSIHEMFRS